MALKHSNPTRPRRDRDNNRVEARAPYNFIPLPEKMVTARPPLDHDKYHEEGLTGWIDCELETCSPTYIRGMMTELVFKEQGRKKPDELTEEDKKARAPFFSTSDVEVEGQLQPVLPGSSLRGMIRPLVEIVGYGRMRWVAPEPTFTFRAVAAQQDDPLRQPYKDIIGNNASQVQAGYLAASGQNWFVVPAVSANTLNLGGQETYIKIKDSTLQALNLKGYIPFNDKDYRPQLMRVSFNGEQREARDSRGRRRSFVEITEIVPATKGYRYWGTLVCAGNMLETGQEGAESPRKRQTLVYPPLKNANPIPIPDQVVKDYLAGLTPFQKEKLSDWSQGQGCLGHLKPVFYILSDDGQEVCYFGHSPNFRIPAQLNGAARAATPLDFVPEAVQNNPDPDLAEAIFGWVEEASYPLQEKQRAGRVYFEDAHFVSAENGIWMEMLTPHILASPKPTTFQHYLVQDKQKRHDPDRKEELAHYGTSTQETAVRGYKMYWHKGSEPDIKATSKEKEHEKQLTRIIPLKPSVKFKSRIRFENLRCEELGALLWVLSLPGSDKAIYRHKLGMGKPLGMGALAVKPTLSLTSRQKRYMSLFADENWLESAENVDQQPYIEKFETYILHAIGSDQKKLAQVERIQMLLSMMQWREGDASWQEKTRYMEIEHGPRKINEYKERPVLPDPLHVE